METDVNHIDIRKTFAAEIDGNTLAELLEHMKEWAEQHPSSKVNVFSVAIHENVSLSEWFATITYIYWKDEDAPK